jgi:hypothetical protein
MIDFKLQHNVPDLEARKKCSVVHYYLAVETDTIDVNNLKSINNNKLEEMSSENLLPLC